MFFTGGSRTNDVNFVSGSEMMEGTDVQPVEEIVYAEAFIGVSPEDVENENETCCSLKLRDEGNLTKKILILSYFIPFGMS